MRPRKGVIVAHRHAAGDAPGQTERVSPTAAAILAAGGGSRFHGETHKLRAPFRGRPLAQWAVLTAADAGLGPTFVITGACPLDDLVPEGVTIVENPRWEEGQATSLVAAVRAAEDAGCDAVVVGLADQPLVPVEAWRAVARSEGAIATAVYGDRRRPPVRLAREVWPLLPDTGDEGARALMRDRPDLVVPIPCASDPVDLDTVEDLRRWS